MRPAIVPLITSLATVVTSGVLASVVTYKLNHNKDQFVLMREKAEALYLSAHEFSLDLSKYVLPFFLVRKGEMDYNQKLYVEAANQSVNPNGGAEMMTMLLCIYFPEVEFQLRGLLDARDRLSELRIRHSQAYKGEAGVGTIWLSEFTKAAREIDRGS